MLVEVVTPFRIRGIDLKPGMRIDVPETSLPKLSDRVRPSTRDLDDLEREYFQLLKRFWKIDDDPLGTIEEARNLIVRLDQLYRQLHQAGRKVPVRLPLERSAA